MISEKCTSTRVEQLCSVDLYTPEFSAIIDRHESLGVLSVDYRHNKFGFQLFKGACKAWELNFVTRAGYRNNKFN